MDSSFDMTRMCKRCRARVETRTMKYDLNGKDLICASCYDKQKGLRVAPKNVSANESKPQGAAAVVHKAVSEEKKSTGNEQKFLCRDCKYKFRNRAGQTKGLKCPYCGSPDVEPFKEMQADDLLRDSLDSRYDR